MTKVRETWADVLKGIGAILVLIGHLIAEESTLKIYLYAFHMPLFFFISGYLFKYESSMKKFIKKKAKILLKPYFIFGILSMVISFIIDGIYMGKKDILKNLFFVNGQICWNSSLWFLIIMFYVVIIFNSYLKIKERLKFPSIEKVITVLLILVMCIIQLKLDIKLLFGIEIIPHCLLMFYLGYLYKENKQIINSKIEIILKDTRKLIPIIVVGIIITYFVSQFNIRIKMSANQYGNYLMYLLVAITSIFLYILIAKKINSNKILEKFSNLSLIMFCTQRILFRFYMIIQNRLGIQLVMSGNIVINVIMVIATLLIYYLYGELKRKVLVK